MNEIDRFFTPNPADFAKRYIDHLCEVLKRIDTRQIAQFLKIILDARERQSTVFFIGNGGSAATASHFANDLTVGIPSLTKPLRVMSLTDNMAVITAVANDNGYEEIFVRQLKVYASKMDVLVAISASGNSSNILSALEYAKSIGMTTVGITSFDGGSLKRLVDHSVHVPTDLKEYGPAEDAHMMINHLMHNYLTRLLKQEP